MRVRDTSRSVHAQAICCDKAILPAMILPFCLGNRRLKIRDASWRSYAAREIETAAVAKSRRVSGLPQERTHIWETRSALHAGPRPLSQTRPMLHLMKMPGRSCPSLHLARKAYGRTYLQQQAGMRARKGLRVCLLVRNGKRNVRMITPLISSALVGSLL